MKSKAKVHILVSSCLLGNPVRYDGRFKGDSFIIDELSKICEFIPVCPEHDSGLPIPRPPMQLYGSPDSFQMKVIENRRDETQRLKAFSERFIERIKAEKIDGIILKSKSPSCGYGTTPFFDEKDKATGLKGSGVFALMIAKALPHLPIIDELKLAEPKYQEEFLRRIRGD